MYNPPNTIQTIHGNYFSYLEPENYEYDIEEIAWSLAKQCRFTGHIKCKNIYSVAQHSVLVSKLLPAHLKLIGLMHDAAEAFMGDVNSPLKALLPEYKRIEKMVEKAIFSHFGLQFPMPEIIKRADLAILAAEKRNLKPPTRVQWKLLEYVLPMKETIKPMDPPLAYEYFMHHWRLYTGNLSERLRHSDFYQIKHFGNERILFEGFAPSKEALLQRALDEDALLRRADLTGINMEGINTYNINLSSCRPFCDE